MSAAVFTADECCQRFNCTSSSISEYTEAIEQDHYDSQTLLYATTWLPNRRIATVTACGQVCLFERHAQSGTTVRAVPPTVRITAHTGPAYTCTTATINNTPVLLTGGDDGKVHGWRCDVLADDAMPLVSLAAPAVDGPCATAAECNSIAVDASTGHVIGGAAAHNAVGNLPHHHRPGFGGGMIHAWDVQHAAPLRSIAGHKQSVASVAMHGASLATAALDGTVREWDLRQGTSSPVTTIQAPPLRRGGRAQMRCVMYDPEGTTLVCGSSYPDLLLFSRVAGKPLAAVQVDAAPQALGSVAGEVLVAGASARLTSYNFLGKVVGRVSSSGSAMYGLAVCEESGMVLACGTGGALDIVSDGSLVGRRG